jgi:NAD+ synthetase
MKIALVQTNPTVGDLRGNVEGLVAALEKCKDADLAIASELAISAYPPRDLLDHFDFLRDVRKALDELARRAPVPALVGFAELDESGTPTKIYNSAALLKDGVVRQIVRKNLLPTYDVFDERRYFAPALDQDLIDFEGVNIGVSICEDIWNDASYWPDRRYDHDPIESLVARGAQLLVNLSASPFSRGKRQLRRDMLASQVKKHGVPLIVVNQVGAHDDLIFDGGSMVFDSRGEVAVRCAEFQEDVTLAAIDVATGVVRGPLRPHHGDDAEGQIAAMTDALILGIRDYVRRCGFPSVILGLSGGIDSALTASLAAHAIGADRVHAVALPSRYSSRHSLDDAEALAHASGIHYQVLPIRDTVAALESTLKDSFAGRDPDVTEENLQARARGILLMALSNKFGHLLLNTGNKSEIAVGYCTLYGDMCGGLSVISDLYKGEVYRMARELNGRAKWIPESTLTKPPSAELKPDQLDQDTLPPYDLLDDILRHHIEDQESAAQLKERGFEPAVVDRVTRMVARAEYKRYQLAPGLKVQPKSFGPGRRMPIAARVPWA